MFLVSRLFSLFCLVSLTRSQTCVPGDNCQLPDCRCADDENIPGGLDAQETPQMILVTFEEAVNEVNADLYRSLFSENNPNGCPSTGTFFIKDQFTDYQIVKELYDEGYEMGAGSLDGTSPTTADDWKITLQTIKENLKDSGVPEGDVLGVRAPLLKEGGLEEFIGMGDNGFTYDASCITTNFDTQVNMKWPYTYDFLPSPTCTEGEGPDAPFPGKWQFLIAALSFNGTKCATPSGCTTAVTQRDVFDMFEESFEKHYQGSRSPYILVVDAQFVLTPHQLAGLQEFLEFVRAAFDDTWVLPMTKALKWIQEPTPLSNITEFEPWQC